MPKGITSLLSDGAAKRKDPGVKAPKKAPPMKKWSAGELEAGASRNMKAYENADGSRTKQARAQASDSLGAIQAEQSSRITRPNAANTRARAANALLSKMPKKK